MQKLSHDVHNTVRPVHVYKFIRYAYGKLILHRKKYIEGIYFFEVNTKYISSSAVKKISFFSRVRSTSENADIFNARDEIYLVFAEKK